MFSRSFIPLFGWVAVLVGVSLVADQNGWSQPNPSASPPQFVAIMNCSPLSTHPKRSPAFSVRVTFDVEKGVLTGERKLRRLPGKETLIGQIDKAGILNVTGRGEWDDRSGGWVIKLKGPLRDSVEPTLTGTLRNGWGKGNGIRACSLAFMAAGQKIRVALSKAGQLERAQTELKQRQREVERDLSGVISVLQNIILPVTEDPNAWMMRVSAVPVQQQQFCRIVDGFYDDLANVYRTRNEIRKNALYRDRHKDLAALLPDGKLENWVVTLKEVTQAPDGSAAVMLQPPCRAMLGSDACRKDGSRIRATITPSSPIFRELERVNAGDFIVISGRLLYATRELPDEPAPIHAVYEAGSHCSMVEGGKQQDVFVTEISYLARLR